MSVPADRVQATFCATLVDEWVRGGITDAVVCPGSRSTPLALALAERCEVALHVRLDERGAGFFALGVALRSERPVVVCTTSGTAAAELHPAVAEADLARVPLLVCTADRPPELHHVGAPQTMDQRGLYGGATRWAVDPGVPEASTAGTWRSLAARALAEAWHGPAGPGPVHLCLAFRDPLAAPTDDPPPGRPDGRPWHQVVEVTSTVPSTVGAGLGRRGIVEGWPGRRGIVVAGAGAGQGADPEAVLALARALGWPVLADPRSGCRRPGPVAVGAADAILRDPAACETLRPDVVLVLGAPWASKVLAQFLAASAAAGAEVVGVDPWWRWADPDRVLATVVRAAPGRWAQAAAERLGPDPVSSAWLADWSAAEAAAQQAMDGALAAEVTRAPGCVPEPVLARRLLAAVPATATVVASSSMPVRDLEWYGPPLAHPPVVLANRGVNGIDGVCSTALGAAAVAPGPVIGLVGDLAFLHDASALAQPAGGVAPASGGPHGPAASRRDTGSRPGTERTATADREAACTLVVPDNHGGAIFSFLPQAAQLDASRFEQLFGTPHQPDVAAVARGFGLACTEVGSMAELDAALDAAGSGEATGVSVVRVRVPTRTENVAVHDRVHRAVADAVAAVLRGS